jgi:hypothetical protein
VIQFCSHTPTINAAHSWLCNYDTLFTQAANSYQWLRYGVPLPETNQYLANYSKYGLSGISVLSTVSGCTEQSAVYTITPQWSGYYFDAMGNPCAGDTVAFAVLHPNGLSGQETILWFKNGVALSSMTNSDTLLITSPAKYECKVINSASNCPYDTAYALVNYTCSVVGIHEKERDSFGSIFPNPASESFTLNYTKYPLPENIQICDATGRLIKSVPVSATNTEINISDLAKGLYFIRTGGKEPPLILFKQ